MYTILAAAVPAATVLLKVRLSGLREYVFFVKRECADPCLS